MAGVRTLGFLLPACFLTILGSVLVRTPVLAKQDSWKTYTDQTDHVRVRFPSYWKTNPAYSDRTYFEGASGFFQLGASSGNSPEQVCRGDASHHLQPYGSNPQVRSITISGKRACIVWPSADQVPPRQAEIVLSYPKPVMIDGRAYCQLVVYADKEHVVAIARSIEFLP